MAMQLTVEDLFGQIEKLKLVSAEEVAAMRGRWLRAGRKDAADPARFCEWLRVNNYLTEFAISALSRGKSDRLILNQYRITDMLRTGAQAGDLLAADPLDRPVRVQIVSPQFAREQAFYEKLRGLVQRLMNVQHAGVAHVLDLGQAHGVDYVVSEYVPGESLEEVLKRRGRLNYGLAARVFALVVDALQALHHQGVRLGDLRAEDLAFASTDKAAGGARTVRIANAGFPRHFFDSSALGIGPERTAESQPRQLERTGETELERPVRPEEDILRLGVLLYRTVIGHEPTSRGGRANEQVRQADPEVPVLLADIIDSMTDGVPANRPKNVAAVAKGLRVFLRTEEEQSPAQVEDRVTVPVQSPPAGAAESEDQDGSPADGKAGSQAAELPPTVAHWRQFAGVEGEPEINKLFRAVVKYEGSDLHVAAGMAPMMRFQNLMRPLGTQVLEPAELEHLMQPILSERSRSQLDDAGGADFAHVLAHGEGRFRVNLFKQRGQLGLVARRVNANIPTFEKLRLPAVLERLCQYDQGMVILAGVTGSGKSTTLAAMLEYINERESVHILTIEDPIEYLFISKKALINQREVGIDVRDWHIALKHAVRQDPDVILVGEMRDRETFEAGLNAAETGHLVFCTIHASSAPSTIGRILDLFPADMHQAMRQSLAFNLKAIVCQKLLPSIRPGVSRVPTNEIMLLNPTVRDLIIKGEDKKLPDAIRIGYLEGMIDFNESLRQLVHRGDLDESVALQAAPNADALKMALKGIKVAQPGIL
ncbi:MAG TPA: PilT/PilU family type 4a pilus ATPase [Gemmataceae bacterium]|nr:PilT/PilU family type 4a pilus ATPase [Gemmataceae bacterium]